MSAENTQALYRLLESWRFAEDVRRGRPPGDLVARARAYVAKEPPAVSGQHGHDRCFHVACVLVKDFGLDQEQAFQVIQDWNATCQPPWSEAELRHKIADALKQPGPVGRLAAVTPIQNGRHGSQGNGAFPPGAPEPAPIIVRLADVQPEPVRWLWPGWMPAGALVVLDGDPGLGKSTLTLDLTARITTSRVMPPGEGADLRGPAGVLLLGAEDSLRHTVRPRLDAAGADNERVFALEGFTDQDGERPVYLPADLERVAVFIAEKKVALVVVDPLMAYLGSDTDAHKDQDVRRALRPLSRLADQLGVTVLLLRHLNKLSGGPALYRGGSSIGITGASRASLVVGRDPDEDRFILAMNKCNLAARPTSLAYRLETAGSACRLVWAGEVDLRPDQILGHSSPPKRGPGRPDDSLQEAVVFLADLLADGPVAVSTVRTAAQDAGIAWRTLERAKSQLEVQARKHGAGWVWEGSPPNCGTVDDPADTPDGFTPFE